jgi:glutamate-5-semialdehyde dehydrogenase
MIKGVLDVKNLEDPAGKVFWRKQLDDGLILTKISCPIGVIGVIFEARPDVIVQISSLAIKSGNCVILKGGREAHNTNEALFRIIEEALSEFKNFPKNVINLIFSREDVKEMLEADEYINLIIPRGSNAFVKYIQENTKIPEF